MMLVHMESQKDMRKTIGKNLREYGQEENRFRDSRSSTSLMQNKHREVRPKPSTNS